MTPRISTRKPTQPRRLASIGVSILVVATISILCFLGASRFKDWIALQTKIDHCLDEGGRWNYDFKTCESN